MKKDLLFTLILMLISSLSADAVTITKTQGWFESGAVEWTWESGATYAVYYRSEDDWTWVLMDKELVRHYPGYGRADMVGLKAGRYQFRVVKNDGTEMQQSADSEIFTATASDRSGFAHYGRTEGVGAYNNDGTLKQGARVLYVTAANAKMVSLDMKVSSSKTETRTGLQNIIQAYEKSSETRPLDVRIIGTIKYADMDEFGSASEGLQVKGGGSAKCNAQLTIEGIGEDAAIHGFGILCRSISSVEFRNFAIMICMDDCLSLDTDNKNIWIHNMDFFYGGTGSDADQAKGDGTVDIKGGSSHVTVSYNHFYDSGKCSLGGMKSETTDCWMTYHHNWFDHSDSRHPRIRTAFYHVYNNYFDGNAKYGTGVTMGGSAFCEGNYFRNCKYPFLSSRQGTDAQGDGTFSGEDGGVIKAYNNICLNPKQVLYYDGKQTDGVWDAVKVESREQTVDATAFTGGTSYNNTATGQAIMAAPTVDDPATIPATVRGDLGAGRMNHGDFTWTFNNSIQDENYGVITELKNALVNYQSTLVAYSDGTAAKNAGATERVNGGDGKGIDQAVNDAYVPSYAGGGGTIVSDDKEPFIIGADNDFYWFNSDNDATSKQYIADKVITLDADSKYNATPDTSDVGKWGLNLKTSTGTCTFYNADGICSLSMRIYRTGSVKGDIYVSTDGIYWTKTTSYSEAKKGTYTETFTFEDCCPYVKVANTSTGSTYIQGVKIYKKLLSGITEVHVAPTTSSTAYSIDGRCITAPTKGQLYIMNGKKHIAE